MRLLSRDLSEVISTVDDVKAVAAQEHRWYAYLHGEKRAKDIVAHREAARAAYSFASMRGRGSGPPMMWMCK